MARNALNAVPSSQGSRPMAELREMDDAQLVSLFLANHARAFDALVERAKTDRIYKLNIQPFCSN